MIASKNRGKISEIRTLLQDIDIEVLSLNDYPEFPEIVEDGRTFLENALKKARTVSEMTNEIALADDSGLEVDFLGGRPGVHSARYSGDRATDESNIRKLLEEMKGVPLEKRGAAFRCSLVLYRKDGIFRSFEGTLRGRIALEPAGKGGFGYDPVFVVPERGKTLAELLPDVKNRISHRAKALMKLKRYLQKKE
ncbi:MAG: XTP/dITP diphosphatase [Syntrophales bacterium]